MAIRWAIANGNWSNITTWNGGTLPVSNDDVFADGKTVTIDQNIIVNSLDTRQRSGGISSGSFVVSQSGIYITASQITSGNSNCLNINLSIGQDCYVFGNITNATYSTAGLISTGGTIFINGSMICGPRFTVPNGTPFYYAAQFTNCVVNMTGNIISSTYSTRTYASGCAITNSTLYLSGDIFGGAALSCIGLISSNSMIFITGSMVGGSGQSSQGVQMTSGSIFSTGNIIGGTGSTTYGLYTNSGTIINTNGLIRGGFGAQSYGVYLINGSTIYATSSISGGAGASSHGILALNNLTIQRLVGNITGGLGSAAFGYCMQNSGYLTVIGNISGGKNSSSIGLVIQPSTGATVNPTNGSFTFSGQIWGGENTSTYGLFIDGLTGTATINGSVFGGTASSSVGLWTQGTNNITINGDVTARAASYGMRLLSAGTTTVNGKVLSSSSANGIYHDGTSKLTINGTQSCMTSGYSPLYRLVNSGSLTINGNILGATVSQSISVFLYDESNSTITINGNITNGNIGHVNGLVYLGRAATLNVNGDVSAGTVANSLAIYSNSSVSGAIRINVVGNVTGGNNATNCAGIFANTANQIITVTGSVTAGSLFPAIVSTPTSNKTIIHGNLVNTSDIMAFYGWKLNIGSTTSTIWTLQTPSGSNRPIASTNVSNGVPTASDVRSGVSFGTVNEFTGTLAVPTASLVSYGTPVDNTVGTAVLNVNDVGALLAGFVV